MSVSLEAFRSEHAADRCTPLIAFIQESLCCTFSTLAFFAFFFHFICLLSFLMLSLTSDGRISPVVSVFLLVWSDHVISFTCHLLYFSLFSLFIIFLSLITSVSFPVPAFLLFFVTYSHL